MNDTQSDAILDWLKSILDDEQDIMLADGLDEAFIGITEDEPPRAVYDSQKVISILIRDGMTYDEAQEFFSFNIECAYVGPGTPLILYRPEPE
jgi:hypothetical protein